MALVNGTEDTIYIISEADLLADSGVEGTFVEGSVYVSEGSVENNGNGTYTLTFPQNFSGTYQVYYLLNNGMDTVPWSSQITVDNVNDAPYTDTLSLELASRNEDSPYTISASDLLFYYADRENDQLTLGNLTADHGSVTDNQNGTWTITPDANFNGVMTLSFDVYDGTDATPGTATYTVNPVEDVPVRDSTPTLPDAGNHQGFSLSLSDLLSGFSDGDGDNLSVASLTVDHGNVTFNGQDSWKITFDAGYTGPVKYDYQVTDGQNYVRATLDQTVYDSNSAPALTDPQASPANATEDESYTVYLADLLTGISDADSDDLSVTAISVDHGSLTDNGDGSWTLTPETNFNGPLTVSYTVADGWGGTTDATLSVTVDAANDAPTGSPSSTISDGIEDLPRKINLSTLVAGFSDVDGDTLRVVSLSADHGSFYAIPGGGWMFTPEANYSGLVTVTYTVYDGHGASISGQTRTFTVLPDNDAPARDTTPTLPDTGNRTTYTLHIEDLLGGISDVENDTLSVTGLTADHATLFDNQDGTWTVTPESGFTGTLTYSYTVDDGHGGTLDTSLSQLVVDGNHAPSRVYTPSLPDTSNATTYTLNVSDLLGGVTDADSDSLSVTGLTADHATLVDNSDGTWTVTLESGYTGALTYSYTVDDGHGGTLDTSLSQQIIAGNHAPVRGYTPTLPDFGNRSTYTLHLSDLLGGVTDADSDSLSVTGLTANHATLVDNHDGTWTVTPASGYTGALTYSYTVDDGHGGMLDTSLAQTVLNGNHAPTGAAPSLTAGTEDVAYTVTGTQLRAGFSDADGDTLSVQNLTASYSAGYQSQSVGYYQENQGARILAQTVTPDNGLVQLGMAYSGGWYTYVRVTDSSGNQTAIFRVNNASGLVVLDDGSIVVTQVFNSGTGSNDLAATRYAANGTVLSSQHILANTADHEQYPDGIALSDGGYMLVWTDFGTTNSVKFQKFNADGTANGSVHSVTSATGNSHFNGRIAELSNGNFAISWIEDGDVYTQRFDSSGASAGTPVRTNTTTTSWQYAPTIAALEGGGYVVMWMDLSTSTRGYQVYDASGAAVGAEKHIAGSSISWTNNGSYGTWETSGNVVGLPDGGFAVLTLTSSNSIGLFRFDASGNQLGGQTDVVAETNAGAVNPKLSIEPDGTLVVSWYDETNNGRVWTRELTNDPGGSATVTYNAGTDSYTVTRPADTNGLLTLNYQVSDGHGGTKTASTTLNINAVNDAPRGSSSTVLDAINEDGSITVSRAQLLAGYSDVDSASISIRNNTVTSSNGTVTYNGSAGTWTITPTANYNGTVTLSYTVWDGSANASNAGSLAFTVNAVNDAPALTGAKATITGATEDVGLALTAAQLKQGYSDVEGDTISISGVSANHGTITDNANGTWTLTPEANYNGTVVISYTLGDGNGGTLATSLNISVAAVNDAPAGSPTGTVVNGTEDETHFIYASALLAGISDADNDTLSVSSISINHGTLTATNGGWFFTPDENYNGAVTVTYTVSDGHGGTLANQTRSFSLAAVNDSPELFRDPADITGTEDQPLTIRLADFLEGYGDVDGDTLSVSGVSVDHGTITNNGNGTWTLVPAANFDGTLVVSYSISDGHGATISPRLYIGLEPVNDAPAGSPSGTIADGTEDTAKTILASTLLAGFTDAEGDTLSISDINVDHGTLTTTTGGWTFTPEANYNGTVTVTYSVFDGQDGLVTDQTLSFELAAVNDAPAGTPSGTILNSAEDETQVIAVHSLLQGISDAEGDGLAFSSIAVDHGTLTPTDGGWTYTPPANFHGTVTVTYSLTDAHGGELTNLTRSFTVTSVNDVPTGSPSGTVADGSEDTTQTILASDLLAGFSDADNDTLSVSAIGVDHGTLTATSGGWTFAPAANYNGPVTLTYTVSDGNGGTLAGQTRSFTLVAANDAPEAPAGEETLAEDGTLSSAVSASDQDGDALTYSLVTGPEHGTIDFRGDGTYVYTPHADYFGDDSFTFKANDGSMDSEVATVALTVTAVNDAPEGIAGAESVDEDGTLTAAVSGRDTENAPLTYALATGPQHGTIDFHSDGTYVYTPNAHYSGSDSFTFTASDGSLQSAETEVALTVNLVNSAPTGAPTSILPNGTEDTVYSVSAAVLLAGFTDPDLDPLSVVNVTADHGTVTNNGNGMFSITPEADYNGSVTLSYGVSDGLVTTAATLSFILDQVVDLNTSSVTTVLAPYRENLTLTGSANIDATGNELDNVLTGNGGANRLTGLGGNDRLNGAAGSDTMVGGFGDDTYVVDNAGDVVTELAAQGIDTVEATVDFTLGANVENLTLLGTGNKNSTGNDLNNVLRGNSGANALKGLGGHDFIDGGAGADRMYGGTGDDTYVVDNIADLVVENAGEGTDMVQTSLDYTLGTNLENLVLTGSDNVSAAGNSAANSLTGNSGNNRLDGKGGVDTMVGGLGDDTYSVDSLSDVVTELGGQGIDTIETGLDYTLGADLEGLTLLGTGNKNGTGNALDNIVRGNAGNNALKGLGGSDFIDGGLGVDRMYGGIGDDTYVIDNVGDVVGENAGEGSDTVQTTLDYTLVANVENLTLTGSGNLAGTGNALGNFLTGNAGNNRLDGKVGADTMNGGLGDDTFVVDNVEDLVSELSGQGADTVEVSIDYALGANLENLLLLGTGDRSGTGNDLGNVLTGNGGVNTLRGMGGNDFIDGGLGADRMYGGIGDDTFVIDNAGDQVLENAGEGTDTVQAKLSYTLGVNIENLTLTGSDSLSATGNSASNILTGNAGNNRLDGKAGADSMAGGLGDDTYVVDSLSDVVTELGGQGIDTVETALDYTLGANLEGLTLLGVANKNGIGNALDNILKGNAGANSLKGLEGADAIDGGEGADSLWGGTGADTFVFNANSGADVIRDFLASQSDTINVNAYSHGTAFGAGVTIASDGLGNAIIDLGSGNVITVMGATVGDVTAHMVW